MRLKALGAVLVLCLACKGYGQGFSHSFSLVAGSVTVSNSQANSSWAPVSVMFSYEGPSTGTAAVWRVSQGRSFNLASCTFSNVTTIVWTPDVAYVFSYGDALRVLSSVTGGFVQVIRRGD